MIGTNIAHVHVHEKSLEGRIRGNGSALPFPTPSAGMGGDEDRHPISHHPQHSFARLSVPSSGCVNGRASGTPPPAGSASIIHHNRQMTPHSKGWGNPLGERCAETLAGRQGRGHGLTVCVSAFNSSLSGFSLAAGAVPPLLTRRLLLTQRSRHFFRFRKINLKSLERHCKCVTQRNPGHSKSPVCYVPTRSNGDLVNVRNIVGEIRNV